MNQKKKAFQDLIKLLTKNNFCLTISLLSFWDGDENGKRQQGNSWGHDTVSVWPCQAKDGQKRHFPMSDYE